MTLKKNNLEYYLISLLLLLVSIIIFKNKYLYCLFMLLITLLIIFRYGLQRDKNFFKSYTIRIVIISIFSYFILIYGMGILTGFTKNIFELSFVGIARNIFFPLITIICSELIRYIYAKKCVHDIKPYIFLTMVYIFLNIIMEFNIDVNNHEMLLIFVCRIVIPTITSQILYSYLTYKVSLMPTVILRLVFELYIYIFPIFPDLGNYIYSLLGLFYPILIYGMVSKNINYYSKNKSIPYIKGLRRKYIYIPLIIFLTIIVLLVSGVGKYQLVAIGSGSMEPIIYRGDAIILKKISADNVKMGDILVYKHNGVIITHRVVGLDRKNMLFKTKGDNNNVVDNYDISADDVLGIVVYNVKYIGYPTILLNEKFG